MPELPEVRNAVLRINKAVKGQKINNIFVNNTKLIKDKDFKKNTIGSEILNVSNKGKFLLFNLDNKMTIVNHLRMTGKFRFEKIRDEQKHDHVIFLLTDGFLVYKDPRAFGTFNLRKTKTMFDELPLSNVGLEANKVDLNNLFSILQKRRSAIKSNLLNQSLVAGLGNIYVNEVLFKAKIDPEKPSNEISKPKLKKILELSYSIMEKATKMGGSSIQDYESFNGEKGHFQDMLNVHKREGLPCKICGKPISKKYVNGRGTFWCTKCQR